MGLFTTTVVRSMTIQVDVLRDEGCFDLPAWRELLTRDPNGHVFSTPEWHKAWWEEFGADKDLVLLTMTRDAVLIGIVPLYRASIEGRFVLRFVGGVDLTDYLGPICATDDFEEVADSLVRWLQTTDIDWDEFDAHNLPVPFGFAEVLVDHVDRQGFAFELEQEETSAVLPLASDWDGYLASLGSKERHELKRKRRRLARDHPDASFRTATEETLEADLRAFVDIHRGAEGMKGHFMRPEIATFFGRVAHTFMPLGWLRLDFLEIGGRTVAATFGFELDKRLYLYNSAYEPEARSSSPGLMLVSELVKEAIERGFERFDFLRGPERYKYQLGAQALPLNNVKVFRGTVGP